MIWPCRCPIISSARARRSHSVAIGPGARTQAGRLSRCFPATPAPGTCQSIAWWCGVFVTTTSRASGRWCASTRSPMGTQRACGNLDMGVVQCCRGAHRSRVHPIGRSWRRLHASLLLAPSIHAAAMGLAHVSVSPCRSQSALSLNAAGLVPISTRLCGVRWSKQKASMSVERTDAVSF